MPPTDGPLAVLTRAATGERLEVRGDATAGRGEGCGVPLIETYASRTHARITFRGGAPWIEDLGSGNGTFVNGVRISAPVQLKAGDTVRFHKEEFVVSLPAPSDAVVPARAVAPAAAPRPAPSDDLTPVPVVLPAAAADATPPKSTLQRRPGAWAHTIGRSGPAKSTKYIPPSELEQMTGSAKAGSSPHDLAVPYLQVISGDRTAENLPLVARDDDATEWSIGSNPQRDIVLPDSGVSAFHARIVSDGERWKIVDQMSANGTFVNGKRSSMSYVTPGDSMRFGPVVCVFQEGASPSEAPDEMWEGPALAKTSRSRWILAAVGALALLIAAYLMLR